ncbi:MAG: AMIN domain-containing protein [Gemmatimonadales bacterium]
MLVAFGAVGGPAAVANAVPTTPNDATVIALSVVPTTGRADVVIRLDGAVTVKHFVLSKPDKIVIDMSGATLALPQGDAYDGVARGGITRIRYSQFTRTVVRVVLTLDAPHAYDVTQSNGEIHIVVDGAHAKFAPWRLTSESANDVPAAPVQVRPVTPPPVAQAPVAQAPESPVVQPVSYEPAARPGPQAYGATAAEIKRFGSQQSQEPRITWSGENTPINDVLAIFSAFTGRTILPSKGVIGTITASINNLPWDVALKEIMNANGYDVTVNPDGVIVIDTFENVLARQSTTPLETRTIRLNYARANAAAPMIAARLTRSCPITAANAMAAAVSPPVAAPAMAPGAQSSGIQSITCPARGTVTADTITNSISITDVPSALADLAQYTRSLDLRQPQVNIKAKIILVDRTTLEGLGLRYDLGSQQQFFNDIVPRLDSTGRARTDAGQILLGGNTISAIANATQRIPSAALQLVYSTAMGNFDFTTFLEALQQNTLLDVQAEPSASVLNNRTANLTAGTQVPIRVIDAGTGGSQTSNFPRATVQMQQTGVILEVTPQITANRQIQMKVHVENSDVQFEANDVGAVFPKQSVDNVVLVADGETAVMGGLTQTTVSISKSGLPVLVDLPIIGRLFGVTTRQETKRDLLILITPHIIDDGQSLPESGRP